MLGLLQREPLLDEPTVEWLFAVYAWALRHFDADEFRRRTPLVLPNERFFPGRAESPAAMAELIFGHVRSYAGMGHWPCRLIDNRSCELLPPPQVRISGALRGPQGIVEDAVPDEQRLPVAYDPELVRNPEAMIAGFAHALAHYLGTLAREPVPGGEESWPHATEVLAIFLGFGLMFANSAFNVRIPRCGACAPPPKDRSAFLSQYQSAYALAIFCVLKQIPAGDAARHLKKPLRGYFKRAMKDVAGRTGLLLQLAPEAAEAPA